MWLYKLGITKKNFFLRCNSRSAVQVPGVSRAPEKGGKREKLQLPPEILSCIEARYFPLALLPCLIPIGFVIP